MIGACLSEFDFDMRGADKILFIINFILLSARILSFDSCYICSCHGFLVLIVSRTTRSKNFESILKPFRRLPLQFAGLDLTVYVAVLYPFR